MFINNQQRSIIQFLTKWRTIKNDYCLCHTNNVGVFVPEQHPRGEHGKFTVGQHIEHLKGLMSKADQVAVAHGAHTSPNSEAMEHMEAPGKHVDTHFGDMTPAQLKEIASGIEAPTKGSKAQLLKSIKQKASESHRGWESIQV